MEDTPDLPDDIISKFSDGRISLRENEYALNNAREGLEGTEVASESIEKLFLHSLALKKEIDLIEQRDEDSPPSSSDSSLLLNLEYQLFKLNEATPLRHNPFLSHWVEAIQRLEEKIDRPDKPLAQCNWVVVWAARLDLIQTILSNYKRPEKIQELATRAPNYITHRVQSAIDKETKVSNKVTRKKFNITPFIKILEDEDIYEHSPAPTSRQAQDDAILNNTDSPPQSSSAEEEVAPEVSLYSLSRLPIDISSLDRLTELLQEQKALEAHGIERNILINEYLQYSLRRVERMGIFSTTRPSQGTSETSNSTQTNAFQERGLESPTEERGRDAQSRAVRLLILFIRNLIRKALVAPETIYFEIQEICVRYVWIREAREFRSFLENGM